MVIVMNGKKIDVFDGATLGAVLGEHRIAENVQGVAVAVNAVVVPKHRWADVRLNDGDAVEVIHAVQGG